MSRGRADLLLRNGVIATVEPARPEAEGLAVAGERILAVGTNDEVEATIGPATEVIDLDGAFVMPGFIEGHGHLLGLGRSLMQLGLRGARGWGEIVAMVADAARTTPPSPARSPTAAASSPSSA